MSANGTDSREQVEPAGNTELCIASAVACPVSNDLNVEATSEVFAQRHRGSTIKRRIGGHDTQPIKTDGIA